MTQTQNFSDRLCSLMYGGRVEEPAAGLLIARELGGQHESLLKDTVCVLASGDASGCGYLMDAHIILQGKAAPHFHSVVTNKIHYVAEKMRTHEYNIASVIYEYKGDYSHVQVRYTFTENAHLKSMTVTVVDDSMERTVCVLQGRDAEDIAVSLQ